MQRGMSGCRRCRLTFMQRTFVADGKHTESGSNAVFVCVRCSIREQSTLAIHTTDIFGFQNFFFTNDNIENDVVWDEQLHPKRGHCCYWNTLSARVCDGMIAIPNTAVIVYVFKSQRFQKYTDLHDIVLYLNMVNHQFCSTSLICV